jgi:hypothetical protein
MRATLEWQSVRIRGEIKRLGDGVDALEGSVQSTTPAGPYGPKLIVVLLWKERTTVDIFTVLG